MKWWLLLCCFLSVEAATTTIKKTISSGKKKFACTFRLEYDYYSGVDLGGSQISCKPGKPKQKRPIDVELVSDDGIVFVGTIKINPSRIVFLQIESWPITTGGSTVETTTFEGQTFPPPNAEEEVEFKELYANVSSEPAPALLSGCGIDNLEGNMRRALHHTKSYTNMLKTQFWTDGKVPWNFVSSGDSYAKFSVYTDADLGLTKDDVDTVTAAMKQIEAKTCIRFSRVKPTKGQAWMAVVREAKASDLSCSLAKAKSLAGKDIGGVGDVFGRLQYNDNCFSGAYAWYGQSSPQNLVISQVNLKPTYQGYVGLLVHEILHVLGLGHTQKRQDAKDNIDIKWANIEKSAYGQYEPCVEAKDSACSRYNHYGTAYDCNSIMHYEDTAFQTAAARAAGAKTMVAKKAGCDVTSNKDKLTDADVAILNKMYCSNVVQEKVVKSPNYPSNYPDSKDEEYKVDAGSGSVVALTFSHFTLEQSDGCVYDWVQVVDSDGSVLLAKTCGSSLPAVVKSKTQSLTVKFHSDTSENFAGFRATWEAVKSAPPKVDGKWSAWTGFSSCSNNKDGKSACVKKKVRYCNNPAAANGGAACQGEAESKETCSSADLATAASHPGCLIHGAWSTWSAASTCSTACKSSRSRTCSNPAPINDKDKCAGSATSESACTGGSCPSTTSGTVKSPNYPENYPSNTHLTFPLQVAAGSVVELTFEEVNIEAESSCGYDYVQVVNSDGSQLVKACGTSKPAVLKSSGNKMTVVFHSDGSEVAKGFSATWKAVAAAAAVTSGVVTSPDYPKNYPNNKKVETKITVAAGKKIELTIVDLNIESSGTDCPYDHLKVLNSDSSLMKTVCGTTRPPTFTSSGTSLTLQFTSDSDVVFKGFKATWKQID